MQARIMIVDDEPATGKLVLYQLRSLGYEATYIQDGIEALQRVLLEQPDLLLLDVMMPQISGWEVCREIRTCSNVPIIMLTAKDADDDVVTGLSAGADDYVTKPFNIGQLQARIEAVLRRVERPRAGASARYSQPVAYQSARVAAHPAAIPVRQAASAPAAPLLQLAPATAQAHAGAPPLLASLPATAPAPPQRLGVRLRSARQSRGLSLYQAECLCRVRWDYLQAIEQENWDYAPRTQLRLALQSYARFLNIDLQEFSQRPQESFMSFGLPMAATVALVLMLIVAGLYFFISASLV